MNVIEGFDPEFIPSITSPSFDVNYFGDGDDRLLVVETTDGARAYPFRILDLHHIVNDVVGDTPIVATYCPNCGSAAAYERRRDGRTLTFEFAGKLVDNNLVMQDRETGSDWKQSTGDCLSGEFAGNHLELYTSRVTTWDEFQEDYPSGVVLQRPDDVRPHMFYQYGKTGTTLLSHPAGNEAFGAVWKLVRAANLARDPDSGTRHVSIRPFFRIMQGLTELRSWVAPTAPTVDYTSDHMSVFQRDDIWGYYHVHGGNQEWEENSPTDLSPKERTLGLTIGSEAVGFPRSRVGAAGGVVQTTVGGTDVVVFAADGELNAFEDPGLTFEPAGDGSTFTARGAEWDGATGENDDGRSLTRLSTSWTYAYAWQDDHGPSTFYTPDSSELERASEGTSG